MRTKEEAHDYRYFPDPDLLPLELTQEEVDELGAHLPELPDEKRARFVRDYALPVHQAARLVAEREMAEYFEMVVTGGRTPRPTIRDPKLAANWVINELVGRLNKEGKDITDSPVAPTQLGAILDLIAEGTISSKIAKDLFELTWNGGGEDPRTIVEQRGLKQVTDLSALEKIVDDIVGRTPTRSPTPKRTRKRSAGSSAR